MATLTARVNDQDKAIFTALCDSIGITTSAAINIFVKAAVRENKIPFEIRGDSFYSEANQAYVLQAMQELREGKGIAHDLIED